MTNIIYIFLFFFSITLSNAQKQGYGLIDSLKIDLNNSREDTTKVRLLGNLSLQYYRFDTDLGIKYAEQGIQLAEKLQWETGLAFSYNYLGTNYAVKGNYPKALEYFIISLSKYTEIGDKQGIAFLSNNLGNLYRILKDYTKAIDFCTKAEQINRELNNSKDLVKVYNNLGSIYTEIPDYLKSNNYYYKALDIARRTDNKELTALLLINIADNKTKTRNYCEALTLGIQAIKISDELNIPYDRASYNSYVGEIYLRIADDSIQVHDNCPYYSNDRKQNLLNAQSYLSVAIKLLEKVNDLSLLSTTSLILSQVYEKLGDTKKALALYKNYSENKDSVFSKDNSIAISNIEKKREIELRDKQIIIQTLEIDKKNSQISSQVVIFILFLLLSALIVYFFYNRQKAQREVKAELEKQKTNKAIRESEDRFRTLYEDAPVGLYRTTPDGKILLANRTLCEMLGYSSFEELSVRNLTQVGFESSFSRDQFIGQIEKHGEVKGLEGKWIRHDGEVIRVKESAKVIRDPEGNILFYDGTVENITDRKRLEQQLLQSQKLEGVGTLAGGIAHDFNNLLAMILGSAELLQHHLSDLPELKKYIDRIIDAAERGTSISRQLLMFSRPDQVKLTSISITQTILELREMLGHFLPKSITIETVIEVENGIIMGDVGQIHQALLNLALNAGDAMTNTGTMTIKEFAVSQEFINTRFSAGTMLSHIAVSVSDTGVGMDESTIAKIFDPFFTTKPQGKGTGLGLAMVYGIVKNHNGFIDVTSTPGAGTTFTLYFPAIAQGASEIISDTILAVTNRNGTILVVDDEQTLRETLSEYLRDSGYTVHNASNGKEALELFRTHREAIDIVITDLGMPEMGGEELYRQLRQIEPSVKVIVSSGYLDGTTKDSLLDSGIRCVLTKPYRFSAIGEELKNIM